MLDFRFAAETLIPVGLFPTGLSLSEFIEVFDFMPGLKLPRRGLREDLPLTSKVSVGVRRKVSEIKDVISDA